MSDSEENLNDEGYDEGDEHGVEDDGMDELFGDDGDSSADDQPAGYAHRSPYFIPSPTRS